MQHQWESDLVSPEIQPLRASLVPIQTGANPGLTWRRRPQEEKQEERYVCTVDYPYYIILKPRLSAGLSS